jgi:hypothetical protein
MLPLMWACPGKLAASRAKTLLSSPMGRSVARLPRSFSRMSSVEKPMEACALCMEPASAVAAPVRYVRSANGRAAPPRNHARSACCCIHWLSGMPASLARLEQERASACLYPTRAAPTPRSKPVASRHFATHCPRDPLPGAACALTPLVGQAARSQRAPGNVWASCDQVVRHPSRLCLLTRFSDSLTSRFPANRLPLFGHAGFPA